jgi:hypothetical protein
MPGQQCSDNPSTTLKSEGVASRSVLARRWTPFALLSMLALSGCFAPQTLEEPQREQRASTEASEKGCIEATAENEARGHMANTTRTGTIQKTAGPLVSQTGGTLRFPLPCNPRAIDLKMTWQDGIVATKWRVDVQICTTSPFASASGGTPIILNISQEKIVETTNCYLYVTLDSIVPPQVAIQQELKWTAVIRHLVIEPEAEA